MENWTKVCNFLFPKKVYLRIIKNNRGTSLTLSRLRFIMLCFSMASNLKLRKYLGKIKTVFGEIDPHTDYNNPSNHQRIRVKNSEAKLLFIDFSKAFNSIHRGKMEQVLKVFGLLKETATTIIILS